MSGNEKVGVGVGTGVSVRTCVFVGLGVGAREGVAVPVGVFVGVAVPVGVAVGMLVGVAVQVAGTAASVAGSASRSNIICSLNNTRLARQQKTRKTATPSPMRMVVCCFVIAMHQLYVSRISVKIVAFGALHCNHSTRTATMVDLYYSVGDQLAIERHNLIGHLRPTVTPGPLNGLSTQSGAQVRMLEEQADLLCQGFWIALRHVEAGDAILDGEREPSHFGGDDRCPTGHGLQSHHAEGFVMRRHDQHIGC